MCGCRHNSPYGLTDDMERVLADIDADYGNHSAEILRDSVLLVFGAPCQLRSLAGQEHGQTIPLCEVPLGSALRS
jgi:hypothetical protein